MAAKKKKKTQPVKAMDKARKKVQGMGVLMSKKEREELLGNKKTSRKK